MDSFTSHIVPCNLEARFSILQMQDLISQSDSLYLQPQGEMDTIHDTTL